jgi:hypothetical protein
LGIDAQLARPIATAGQQNQLTNGKTVP